MRLHCLLYAVALVAAVGCQAASPPPASASAESCDLATVGPLVGYSYQSMPQPVPSGGAIPDGIYDLVRMVDHSKSTGPWSSNEAPALRMAFRFKTEERSPNHTEGTVVSGMDIPPAHFCEPGRFATIGQELRGLRSRNNELSSTPYSSTPNGVMLLFPHATFVFRRRS